MTVGLPGVCVLCRQPVEWRERAWREPGGKLLAGNRHICRCDAWMRGDERCARLKGHTTEHRTAYSMGNAYFMSTGRERIA